MDFLWSALVAIVAGAIIGGLGRAILPGRQDIGLIRTILLGIVAVVVVNLLFTALDISGGLIVSTIVGAIVAAALLWLAIRQGWLKAAAA